MSGQAEKTSHWHEALERWRGSGLSQARFCRENQVAPWQFRYWLKRERRGQGEAVGGFVPVTAKESGLALRLPSGAELAIAPDFDIATLRRVLGCLGPC